eukprot:c30047_g1_i1 orf=1-243(-)
MLKQQFYVTLLFSNYLGSQYAQPRQLAQIRLVSGFNYNRQGSRVKFQIPILQTAIPSASCGLSWPTGELYVHFLNVLHSFS